ncbi:hypothetical protein LXL04_009452 [Taraxacum kok-saghyz]
MLYMLGSFENSYIPENPRTPKPLTFSKNRLRGAKNRSNISPVAKKNSEKTTFFFPKNFAYFFVLFQNRSKTRNVFKYFYRSLYNTYLKRFVKKFLKKNEKKSCTYAQKIKKSCTYAKVKKKYRFFGIFFQRIVMIKNVLEGSEVGFLKGITCWDLLRIHIFPRTRELHQFPISPKPLFLSKNRLRDSPKLVFSEFFFATGLKIERFLAPRSRFFEKMLVQVRTIIKFENGGTNLDRYKSHMLVQVRTIIKFENVGTNLARYKSHNTNIPVKAMEAEEDGAEVEKKSKKEEEKQQLNKGEDKHKQIVNETWKPKKQTGCYIPE